MALLGAGADDAWAEIERARGRPVPDTLEQRAWLESFADARLSLVMTTSRDGLLPKPMRAEVILG
jgi:hypothetical protein